MTAPRSCGGASSRYVLGLDFGTLSGRAVLVDVANGKEVATVVHEYADGVIETSLPRTRLRLPPYTALQNPRDYLEVLQVAVPKLLRQARVNPESVIGIGTDFTCCTILPTRADGTPLSFDSKWRRNPHAWVKIWKHHSAQPEADYINTIGHKRGERFITAYGGKYSSEWFFSKVLETVRQAPEVYEAADRLIEAGDWIVWQLCGEEKRSESAAGFKAMRVYPDGEGGWTFPTKEFFRSLHPKLTNVIQEKVSGEFYPVGSKAGGLSSRWAQETGLIAGTPVAVGNIDAHAAVPACSVTDPGKLVMIMGTSTCHLLVGKSSQPGEGICGVVEHGVIPGLWGYEAGQAAVGDIFAWYTNHAVPSYLQEQARQRGLSIHHILEKEASRLAPGGCGLLALDWWNGNRSVLMNAELNGLIIGLTLASKPHEIYRALLEATAFGTRRIIEAFEQNKVAIYELYACGGLAQKNSLLLQIYADVTGRPIKVAASQQTSALGAAMHGAVAAGVYPNINAAARKMARVLKTVYRPNRKAKSVYDRLYAEYLRLHEAFGRDPSGIMRTLHNLRKQAISR